MITTERQWEYCQLFFYEAERRDGEWYYDLILYYCGTHVIQRILASKSGENAKPFSYNPFKTTMGLLGLGEWELVSVQHASSSLSSGSAGLYAHNIVAYFKRPVQSKRNVDEPNLVLP